MLFYFAWAGVIVVVVLLTADGWVLQESIHICIIIILCMLNFDLFIDMHFALTNEKQVLSQVTFFENNVILLFRDWLQILANVLLLLFWKSNVIEFWNYFDECTLFVYMTFLLGFVDSFILVLLYLKVPTFSHCHRIKELGWFKFITKQGWLTEGHSLSQCTELALESLILLCWVS